MNINLTALRRRLSLAAGVAAAVVAGQVQKTGALPPLTAAEAAAVAVPALLAMIPAGPSPLGILTPAEPGGKALVRTLAEVALAAWNAPRERRAAAAAAALEARKAELRAEAAEVFTDLLNRSGAFERTPAGLVPSGSGSANSESRNAGLMPAAPAPPAPDNGGANDAGAGNPAPQDGPASPPPAAAAADAPAPAVVPSWLVTNKEQTS